MYRISFSHSFVAVVAAILLILPIEIASAGEDPATEAFTGVISGAVRDAVSGDLIQWATVNARWQREPGDPPVRQMPEAVTDGSGAFRLSRLPRDRSLNLWIKVPGYISELNYRVGAASDEIDIMMEPASTIRGRVVSEREDCVGGGILLLKDTAAGLNTHSRRAAIQPDGTFEIKECYGGTYLLYARVGGCVTPGPWEITVERGGIVEEISLPMTMGGRLAIRLTDRVSGKNVEGIEFSLRYDGPLHPPRQTTGAEGRALWTGLDRGRYRLYPSIDPGDGMVLLGDAFPLEVGLGKDYEFEFHWVGPSRIQGRVVDRAGVGIPGATVTVARSQRETNLAVSLSTLSDDEGGFDLAPIPPSSTNALYVEKWGYGPVMRSDVASGSQDVPVRMKPAGAISGTVTDDKGEPLGGAEVVARLEGLSYDWLDRISTHHGTPRAGADGTYRLENLAEGEYTLTVNAGKYRCPPRNNVPVRSGEETSGINFVLNQGFTVNGRVVEKGTDRGLKGFEVEISWVGWKWETVTGDNGSFVLENVHPGSYRVSARDRGREGPSFSGASQLVTISGHDVIGILLEVTRLTSVSGRVTDEEGKPIPGATFAYRQGGSGMGLSGRTAEDGTFEFNDVRPGKGIYLTVNARGYPSFTLERLDLEPGERVTGLEIVIPSGQSISGKVLNAEGNPVADAGIWAHRVSDSREGPQPGVSGGSAKSSSDGTYRIKDLQPGKYRIKASVSKANHHFMASERVEYLREGQPLGDVDLVIDMPEIVLTSLRGRVINEKGDPVPGCNLGRSSLPRHIDAGSGGHTSGYGTDAEGFFHFRDIISGTYEISVWPPFPYAPVEDIEVYAPSEELTITVSELAETEEAAEYGSIAGRVIDASTGDVLRDFECVLPDRDEPRSSWRGEGPPKDLPRASTRSDGTFLFEKVKAARGVRVRVQADGYLTTYSDSFEVKPGVPVTGIEIAMERPAAVAGTVKHITHNRPIEGAAVTLHEVDQRFAHLPRRVSRFDREGKQATTDARGRFGFRDIRPGIVDLVVTHPEYAGATVMGVTAPAAATGEIRIDLHPGGTIQGIVKNHAGEPFVHETMLAVPYPFDYANIDPSNIHHADTDKDGHFAMDRVFPGFYSVTIQRFGPAEYSGTRHEVVEVTDEATAEVDLTVPVGTVFGNVTHKGDPFGGHTVIALSPVVSPWGTSSTSHSEGLYRMEQVPAGLGIIRVYSSMRGMVPLGEREFELSPGGKTRVDVQVGFGSISGTVVSDPTGERAENPRFRLIPADYTSGPPMRRWELQHYGEPDGTFVFEEIPPGDYILSTTVWNIGESVTPVSLVPDKNIRDLTIPVGEGGSVQVDVNPPFDEKTQFPGVGIDLFVHLGERRIPLPPRYGQPGGESYLFRRVPPGTYTMIVRTQDSPLQVMRNIEVRGGETTHLSYARTGGGVALTVQVSDTAGNPLYSASPVVSDSEGLSVVGGIPDENSPARTEISARLPRDTYHLHIEKPGYKKVHMPLDLRDAPDTYEMAIQLEKD